MKILESRPLTKDTHNTLREISEAGLH